MKKIVLVTAALFIAACAQTPMVAPVAKMKDGELATPANYKSWPTFLANIDRPDVKQVRDIYINPVGAATAAGKSFPNGTVSVMEIYKAQENADGTLVKSADGKLQKGALAKVFLMSKGEDWGASAPEGLKNGDWVYAAYLADGKTVAPDSLLTCRGCHLPLGEKNDFVHRYDEYFQKRKS